MHKNFARTENVFRTVPMPGGHCIPQGSSNQSATAFSDTPVLLPFSTEHCTLAGFSTCLPPLEAVKSLCLNGVDNTLHFPWISVPEAGTRNPRSKLGSHINVVCVLATFPLCRTTLYSARSPESSSCQLLS